MPSGHISLTVDDTAAGWERAKLVTEMRDGILQELLEDDMKCEIGAVKAAPEYARASHPELRHDVREHLRGRGSRQGEKRNTRQARAQPSNSTIGGTKLVAPAASKGGAEVLRGRCSLA